MQKNKQRGFGTVQIVIAVIILTVIAGLLWERHSLMADNKKLAGDLEVSQQNLKTATDANEGLKLDLKTSKDLSGASGEQAVVHQNETKAQEKKFSAVEKKLPKAVEKPSNVQESDESLARNMARIDALWESYCIDNTAPTCSAKEPS